MPKYSGNINIDSRVIQLSPDKDVRLVQNDKETTLIEFEISKDIGLKDIDLSLFNIVINYTNIDEDTNEQVTDIYSVQNKVTDGEKIKFSWLVGSNATVYAGVTLFQVVLTLSDDDYNITNQYDSVICSIPVFKSLENVNITQGQNFKDFIDQILSGQIIKTDKTLTMPDMPADAEATGVRLAEVSREIELLKKSVSDGKSLVASAITEKGVETATDATFQTMHDNILSIKSGGSTGGSGSVITKVGNSIKTHTSNQIASITNVGKNIKTMVTSRKLEEKFVAVHSNGNSWVDTEINGKSTIKIQLKFKMQKATGAIFVGMMLSGDQALRFFGYGNNWYMDYGGDGHRIIGGLIDTTKTYEFELGNNYIKDIESGSYIAKGNEVGTFEYGFGDSHIKVLTSGEIGDIYYCKIYDGDTLVRDFVPKYDADNKPKLYDNVSNTYFENKGTEEFTAVKELM